MSLGEDSVETMNILYESVDISDVDIEKDKSLTYSNGDCSLNGAEQMNEHGFTKKGNIRRYLLRFVSTSLGFLTLFAVAVFMDLHLNEPKFAMSTMDVEILFPTRGGYQSNAEDVAIASKVRSDYLIKHGHQTYRIADAKCTIQYENDEPFSTFHLSQKEANERLHTDFKISRYHVVRDLVSDVNMMYTGSRMVPKSLEIHCANPEILFNAWGVFPFRITSPVGVHQNIFLHELMSQEGNRERKSSGLKKLLNSDFSIAVHDVNSKSAFIGLSMRIGEVFEQGASSIMKSFVIHLPEVEYAVDRFDPTKDGWIVTTQAVSFDLTATKDISSNVSISCSDIPTDNGCSLYTPLFTKSGMLQDFNSHKHVNISAVAMTQNFVTSFIGGNHWIDFHKSDVVADVKRGNGISLQENSDVSTGGNCVLINTDDYYYLDKCDVIDPNFFMLFVSVTDKNDNNIVTLNSLTSWQLQGPFAALSNTTLKIYDNLYGNATFMAHETYQNASLSFYFEQDQTEVVESVATAVWSTAGDVTVTTPFILDLNGTVATSYYSDDVSFATFESYLNTYGSETTDYNDIFNFTLNEVDPANSGSSSRLYAEALLYFKIINSLNWWLSLDSGSIDYEDDDIGSANAKFYMQVPDGANGLEGEFETILNVMQKSSVVMSEAMDLAWDLRGEDGSLNFTANVEAQNTPYYGGSVNFLYADDAYKFETSNFVSPSIIPTGEYGWTKKLQPCDYYITGDTNFATQNYMSCQFTVCAYSWYYVYAEKNSPYIYCDNTYVRVLNSVGDLVSSSYDSDGCGVSTKWYPTSDYPSKCQAFELQLGCVGNVTCYGSYSLVADGNVDGIFPYEGSLPTMYPTTFPELEQALSITADGTYGGNLNDWSFDICSSSVVLFSDQVASISSSLSSKISSSGVDGEVKLSVLDWGKNASEQQFDGDFGVHWHAGSEDGFVNLYTNYFIDAYNKMKGVANMSYLENEYTAAVNLFGPPEEEEEDTPSFVCEPYNASSTNNATINYTVCGLLLCPGATMYVGSGYNANYYRLYNSEGAEVAFSVGSLQFHNVIFDGFDASNTSSALQNYTIYSFTACTNVSIVTYYRNVYFRLFDSNGYQVAESSAYSQGVSYNGDINSCDIYYLHAGCYGNRTCSANLVYVDFYVYTNPSGTLNYRLPSSSSSCETLRIHEGCYANSTCANDGVHVYGAYQNYSYPTPAPTSSSSSFQHALNFIGFGTYGGDLENWSFNITDSSVIWFADEVASVVGYMTYHGSTDSSVGSMRLSALDTLWNVFISDVYLSWSGAMTGGYLNFGALISLNNRSDDLVDGYVNMMYSDNEFSFVMADFGEYPSPSSEASSYRTLTLDGYSASNTNSATQNYTTYEFLYILSSYSFDIDTGSCDNSFYRLFDSSGNELCQSEGGSCSFIWCTLPSTSSYVLHAGCYDSFSCDIPEVIINGSVYPYEGELPTPAPTMPPGSEIFFGSGNGVYYGDWYNWSVSLLDSGFRLYGEDVANITLNATFSTNSFVDVNRLTSSLGVADNCNNDLVFSTQNYIAWDATTPQITSMAMSKFETSGEILYDLKTSLDVDCDANRAKFSLTETGDSDESVSSQSLSNDNSENLNIQATARYDETYGMLTYAQGSAVYQGDSVYDFTLGYDYAAVEQTWKPTSYPTSSPSTSPSFLPSIVPSMVPSGAPSSAPSLVPSSVPSMVPSVLPSIVPSMVPSGAPSSAPSSVPSSVPSMVPSGAPSLAPSMVPSSVPSMVPSGAPSSAPLLVPSSVPSMVPSRAPSSAPSSVPSSVPSMVPSRAPSSAPSSVPSSIPSTWPTSIPTGVPSSNPTSPTSFPSMVPSSVPSSSPSGIPSARPTHGITTAPTFEQGDLVALSFEVKQTVNGVSFDDYKRDSAAIDEAFLNTVATVLELFDSNGSPDVSGLTLISVSPLATTISSMLRIHLQSSGLSFDYKVQIVVGEGNDYTSPNEAYNESEEKLDTSVEDGAFTDSLRSSGITALSHATADEIPTVFEPEQDVIRPWVSAISDKLGDGAIAGITIAVFVCVLIGGFIYYRIQSKNTFMKNLKQFRAENATAQEHAGNVHFGEAINPMRSTAHNEGATGLPSNPGADIATNVSFNFGAAGVNSSSSSGAENDIFTGAAGVGVGSGAGDGDDGL